MTMITPSYLGETIEYSSLHACRSTLEDPTERIGKGDAATRTQWSGEQAACAACGRIARTTFFGPPELASSCLSELPGTIPAVPMRRRFPLGLPTIDINLGQNTLSSGRAQALAVRFW